jgi:aryl-alcohol dehydrogenase-like predicted oxidoreductase
MRYRELGSTGLLVSEIGFGAWGIGGLTEGATSYGATDDAESRRTLRTAFEAGITFYDTSDIYGYGHSEELIGLELGDVRQKIVIASKVGFTRHLGPHDLSADHIRRSLEGTLRRLRTDYLDLYQLHSPSLDLVRSSNAVDVLKELKAAGLIRAYGISLKAPEDGLAAIEEFGFRSIQVNFSLVDQRIVKNGLLEAAALRRAGIIARTPLCFGFLTGTLREAGFRSEDHRAAWPESQRERWAKAPDMFAFLNQGKARTPVQLALAFCLAYPAVASAIPGMLHPDHALENASASGPAADLSAEELERIELLGRTHSFFDPKDTRTT